MRIYVAGVKPSDISDAIIKSQKTLIEYAVKDDPKVNALFSFDYIVKYFIEDKKTMKMHDSEMFVTSYGTAAIVEDTDKLPL